MFKSQLELFGKLCQLKAEEGNKTDETKAKINLRQLRDIFRQCINLYTLKSESGDKSVENKAMVSAILLVRQLSTI